MKYIGLLLALAFLFTALIYSPVVYGQDGSPPPVPTVEPTPPDVPPDLPDDPVPIPPTFLELILQVIQELGGWLTGLILVAIVWLEKEAVSWTRRWFPNDKKTATKVNGGLAKIFAGLTAIAVALIAWGVTFATGYVSGFDLGGILALVGMLFGGGEGMHKVNKLSAIAKALTAK